jgi:hypothetical protein
MKMKTYKFFLKAWIAAASLAAFLGGWIALGHFDRTSAAPSAGQQAAASIALPALESLPSIGTGTPGILPVPRLNVSPLFLPSTRTRAS